VNGDTNSYEEIRTRARKLMLDQLSDLDLSAASLAADLGIPEKRLHRAFAADNAAIGGEIKSIRMERAKDLLTHTRYLVRFVARLVGYRCTAAFAKAFRTHTSLTPKQWRIAHGGPRRAGGPTGAFYKPAERARARREGGRPPSRPLNEPGSWAAYEAEIDEAARVRARRRGEPLPSRGEIDQMTTSLDMWRELNAIRRERTSTAW
jgi:AraC-like DNA-binding protein